MNLDGMRRRLAFLAGRRSMAEMERLLDRFLERELKGLDERGCTAFLALLEESDADLLDWMGGIKPIPARIDADALSRLSVHAREYS
ncbi:MAG: succinate dehydrogenase assembly factor 2 [Magnetococcales bacterium]|nr:succinate dehydrogenase assembly factor 2 [Magnetococcales bacterium]